MRELIGIFLNADIRKNVSKFSGFSSSFSLNIYPMEKDLYKQIKLAKNIRT